MSRTVWKFLVKPTKNLDLPMGWEVVDVSAKGDEVFMWVMLDPNAPRHREVFVSIPTGGVVPDDADHVGSWHMDDGLVFHLFVLAGKVKPLTGALARDDEVAGKAWSFVNSPKVANRLGARHRPDEKSACICLDPMGLVLLETPGDATDVEHAFTDLAVRAVNRLPKYRALAEAVRWSEERRLFDALAALDQEEPR